MTTYTTSDVQKVTRIMGVAIIILSLLLAVFVFANWRMSDRLDYQYNKIQDLQTEIESLTTKTLELEVENETLRSKTPQTLNPIELTELEALREFYFRTTGHEVGEVREVTIEATRYTNAEGWWDKGHPNYGMQASGLFTSYGAVAAPRSIPFGSRVMITDESLSESSEVFRVEDRGGAIKVRENGNVCIDIWTPESEIKRAFAFGRQKVSGYIIIPKEGSES